MVARVTAPKIISCFVSSPRMMRLNPLMQRKSYEKFCFSSRSLFESHVPHLPPPAARVSFILPHYVTYQQINNEIVSQTLSIILKKQMPHATVLTLFCKKLSDLQKICDGITSCYEDINKDYLECKEACRNEI